MCAKKQLLVGFLIQFFFLSNFVWSQNSFTFKLCNNEINFNISKDNLLMLFPDIYSSIDNEIKDIAYYSLEMKSESDYWFCLITFSFYKAKLYEIKIQNNLDNIVSDEIIELTRLFEKVGEEPNEIEELDVYNNTIIYQRGNLKLSMTDYSHFTFCFIKDVTIEKEIKQQYPDFKN